MMTIEDDIQSRIRVDVDITGLSGPEVADWLRRLEEIGDGKRELDRLGHETAQAKKEKREALADRDAARAEAASLRTKAVEEKTRADAYAREAREKAELERQALVTAGTVERDRLVAEGKAYRDRARARVRQASVELAAE
jgi:hypothetical protein